jgi:Txe/YoeB family toxin of Txe-Axe toxin-antitoxin module
MVKNLLKTLLVFGFSLTPLGVFNLPVTHSWELVDETVAVVNGEPILMSDIKLYALLFGEKDPKKALDKLINIYLVAQYAESRGLEIPPKKVQEIVENFAKSQGISIAKFYEELQKYGLGGAVFNNFIKKYNLYVGAIQFFVIKPLKENKELDLLIGAKVQAKPLYRLKILAIPKKVAEKHEDLLLTKDIDKIAKKLHLEPNEITAKPDELKPQFASVVRRLKKGQTDFAEDQKNLYLVEVEDIKYEIPQEEKQKAYQEIVNERIEDFIRNLKKNSVIKIVSPEFLKIVAQNGGR